MTIKKEVVTSVSAKTPFYQASAGQVGHELRYTAKDNKEEEKVKTAK